MSATNSLSQGVTLLRPEIEASDAVDKSGIPRPRILIVDDISDNRTILTRRFQRRGFDVVEADSGFTAIELIDKDPFDLVLLDVMMPGIDGIETLKRIRSQRSASALPVLSYGVAELVGGARRQALGAGMTTRIGSMPCARQPLRRRSRAAAALPPGR